MQNSKQTILKKTMCQKHTHTHIWCCADLFKHLASKRDVRYSKTMHSSKDFSKAVWYRLTW